MTQNNDDNNRNNSFIHAFIHSFKTSCDMKHRQETTIDSATTTETKTTCLFTHEHRKPISNNKCLAFLFDTTLKMDRGR